MSDSATAWTPGPWQWFGNTAHAEPYLATVHGGRVFVLDTRAVVETCSCCDEYDSNTEEYTRGCDTESMHRARGKLRFQINQRMVDADKLAQYEVIGYQTADPTDKRMYRHDFAGFDHPDAKLIALAPELAEAFLAEYEQQHKVWCEYNPDDDPDDTDEDCVQCRIAAKLYDIQGVPA